MSVGMGRLASEDYIVKPFNITDLKERIDKILNKPKK
jgi:DNA-binding response OmpR family regulator